MHRSRQRPTLTSIFFSLFTFLLSRMTTLFSILLPLAKSAHQRVRGSRIVFEYSNDDTDTVL
jgi:hypothetical protein